MARGDANSLSANAPTADGLVRAAERVLLPSVAALPGLRMCVGLSGGIDSIVLLDVLAVLARRYGWRLSAIHVNHQLSTNAPTWAAFCRRACRARGVPLRVVKVEVARGNSTEAAAREARYAAYRACRADVIALAHNQDDQVETLLLRLLRGAGVKGLAGMPHTRMEGALRVVRPLLDAPRHEIERYAVGRGLQWVEDESNSDTHYLRNFLRADVLPRIAARVPGYRGTLTRAAGHLAEAAVLLDELAQLDAAQCIRDDALSLEGVRCLSRARAGNLLRHFLARVGIAMPDKRMLDEALRQALHARGDAHVHIDFGTHVLRRFDGALYLTPRWNEPVSGIPVRWRGERVLRIATLGASLKMSRNNGKDNNAGIDLACLNAAPVYVRLRRGGERLRPEAGRPRRWIKDLFQEHKVPPWVRDRLPFLWSGRHLVWVPGIGIDLRFQARAGAPSVMPQWLCDAGRPLGSRGVRHD